MKIIAHPSDKLIKRLFFLSLPISIILYLVNYQMIMISGEVEVYIKSLSLFDAQLVRQNLTILANSSGKMWIVSALIGDFVFEIFLGMMFYSAGILIYRNDRILQKVSRLGKHFASLGLFTALIALLETTLLGYMLFCFQTFPAWIVSFHYVLLNIAGILVVVIVIFLLVGLFLNMLKNKGGKNALGSMD